MKELVGLLRRWRLLCLAVGMAILVHGAPASAACSLSSGNANLGTVSSFTAASAAQTAQGTSGFKCTGSLLSIASSNTITATIASSANSLGNQPRLRDPISGDFIPFVLCKDSACSTTYSVGSSFSWTSTTFAGVLGLFNATDGSLPIYFRTLVGTHATPGTYTDSIAINWQWHLCSVGAAGVCVYDDGSGSSTITVTMVLAADCVLSAPNAGFGSAAFMGSFDPVLQTITVRCSKGSAYSVGIDDGQNFLGTRRLSSGSDFIAYEIYYPEGSSNRWGKVGAERRSSGSATTGAGAYTGTNDQTYTYRAEILGEQSTPAPGIYSDTLILDIQF